MCALSDVGSVRSNNEDMFLVENRTGRDEEFTTRLPGRDFRLFAVADGMGGHSSGEIASERTLALLIRARAAGLFPVRPEEHDRFRLVMEGVHHDIQAEAARLPETHQMGATLVGCLLFPEGRLVCFHAGDSRLYRLRAETLERLTVDHTVKEEFSRAGGNSDHIGGHLVTSCIGGGMDRPRVDTAAVPGDVLVGDRYLLCSDGLTDMVGDGRIAELLAGGEVAQAAHSLVGEAKHNGGQDNITVVLIEVGG